MKPLYLLLKLKVIMKRKQKKIENIKNITLINNSVNLKHFIKDICMLNNNIVMKLLMIKVFLGWTWITLSLSLDGVLMTRPILAIGSSGILMDHTGEWKDIILPSVEPTTLEWRLSRLHSIQSGWAENDFENFDYKNWSFYFECPLKIIFL